MLLLTKAVYTINGPEAPIPGGTVAIIDVVAAEVI
jgi:hypothetical protein